MVLGSNLVHPSTDVAGQIRLASSTDCSSAFSGFVQLRVGNLCVKGVRARFIGVDSYAIISYYLGLSSINATTMLHNAGQAHLTTVRFNLDHDQGMTIPIFLQNSDHQVWFSAVDRIVADARRNNVHLNPVIGTAGAASYWSARANNTDFWIVGSQANVLYKNSWVGPIVSHYASEPQIAWWDMESEEDIANNYRIPVVVAWATDMASFIRSIDHNHLLGGGWAGYIAYSSTTNSLNFTLFNQRNSFVDVASLHTYCLDAPLVSCRDGSLKPIYETGITDLKTATFEYVRQVTADAKSLGVAMYWGEYGQNLPADPTGQWEQWLMEAGYTYNADATEAWSWDEDPPVTGTCGEFHISQSCTPALIQAMTHWSNLMSAPPSPPNPPSNPCFLCVTWAQPWLMITIVSFLGITIFLVATNFRHRRELARTQVGLVKKPHLEFGKEGASD